MAGAEGPLVAHVPFRLDADRGAAELHLMRSNPVARAAEAPVAAVLAVQGPDGYVSPDWYGIADQVPTWNYVAVHLRGRLVPMPPETLHAVLDRLSAHFEAELRPKRPWTSAKMPAGVMARMMRSILPFRLEIEAVDGTWKLGQNKPDAAERGAAEGVNARGIGQETRQLAALMRGAGSDPSA
jgi:transcriptional regulator